MSMPYSNPENSRTINDGAMFVSENYKRIMHNIDNEGNYTNYIFEEEHDDYTVPIIYTQEEDDAMMRKFNETMFVPTPKSNVSMKEIMQ